MKKFLLPIFIATALVATIRGAAQGFSAEQLTDDFHTHLLVNDINAVEKALAAGINPDVRNKQGGTPLGIAAQKGFLKIVELLLAYGADPNLRSGIGGFTALALAASTGRQDLVKVLLDAGADQHIPDKMGFTPLHVATFGKHSGVVELLTRYEMNR